MKERYIKEINPLLQKEFQYKSPMQVPRLEKIVVNMGLGRAVSNNKIIEEGRQELKLITGQAPVVTKAKKSIATFKLREGMPIGIKVDLRGDVMYNFLQKVITIGLPSVRDFRGLSAKSFDSRGNYTFGISEHIVFPEIDYDKVNLIKGMDITIVTTANTDAEALVLIKELGLPINVERGNK